MAVIFFPSEPVRAASDLRDISSEAEIIDAFDGKAEVSATTPRTIKLTDNVSLSSRIIFGECSFILDLNGKELRIDENGAAMLSLYRDSSLTIKDSGSGGIIQNNSNVGILTTDNSILSVESGKLYGSTSNSAPSIQVGGNSVVNIYGGSFFPGVNGFGVIAAENASVKLDTKGETYIGGLLMNDQQGGTPTLTVAAGQGWKDADDTDSVWAELPYEVTDRGGDNPFFDSVGTIANYNVSISPVAAVTFKVVNGSFADGTTKDKKVYVSVVNGKGTLAVSDIPAGMKNEKGYCTHGEWETADITAVDGDMTHTYTFKNHDMETVWTTDEMNHWHRCAFDDAKSDVAAHTSDGGKITTKATDTQTGVKTYSCVVCGHVLKTEIIPVVPKDSASGAAQTENPDKTAVKNTQAPKTGDTSNAAVWLVLMLLSAVGSISLIIYDRKRYRI